jgi:hypothetical protein
MVSHKTEVLDRLNIKHDNCQYCNYKASSIHKLYDTIVTDCINALWSPECELDNQLYNTILKLQNKVYKRMIH